MKMSKIKSIKKFVVADVNKVHGGVRSTRKDGPYGCDGDLKYASDEYNKTSSEANEMNVFGGRDYNIC